MIIEILKITIFSIVEGITEWIPISSTGHLIILNQIITLNFNQNFVDLFLVVIQFGAILAVISTFFRKLSPINKQKNCFLDKTKVILWIKIIISCLPVAIIALLFEEKINKYFYNKTTICLSLIIVGLIFIFIEKLVLKTKNHSLYNLSYKDSLLIGFFQTISAIFPGVSRSGATIISANILGNSKEVSIEYSFCLSIPVMFGASIFKLVKYYINGFYLTIKEIFILIYGMLIAYIISLFVIKFLINYLKKHSFKNFGFYRIFLGFLILLLI